LVVAVELPVVVGTTVVLEATEGAVVVELEATDGSVVVELEATDGSAVVELEATDGTVVVELSATEGPPIAGRLVEETSGDVVVLEGAMAAHAAGAF
jgi:hypothetical protein